ncbi:MAG: hypothetical protein OES32_19205 [Acidobacteriota bacterium]|nr:hypothetical protein [Acidobacteriota bacterium]
MSILSPISVLDGVEGTLAARQVGDIVGKLYQLPSKAIQQDVFEYRYQLFPEDPDASAWLLAVYSSTYFFGMTVPDERLSGSHLKL